MEKYIFEELPQDQEIVLIRLQRYNGVQIEAKFMELDQVFLILENGLIVQAIEIETWQKII
jgi:hypothetical protein